MKILPYLAFIIISEIFCIPEDACLSMDKLFSKHNYTGIRYNVTTPDGYRLSIFRIVSNKNTEFNEKTDDNRIPLIMMHGIACGADNYLGHGKLSHAFYFFDQGYDVWLPGNRGTKYSKFEGKTPPENYFDYSLEELGKYDTKTFIDFVYNVTNRKINYLAYSQGFTQLMIGFSLEPEFYKQRLNKIAGWAPVVRLDLGTHPGVPLASFFNLIKIADLFGWKYIFENTEQVCINNAKMCDYSKIICKLRYFISGDFFPFYDPDEGFSHGADSVSLKILHHFLYNFEHQGFYRYNDPNFAYDLTKVQGVDIGLFVGEGDMMASKANSDWLQGIFGKTLKFYKVYPYLGF